MATYATINLTRFSAKEFPGDKHAYPLTVIAEGINIPAQVFVYRVEKPEDNGDTFRCVACVNDLYEFPSIRSPFQVGKNDWVPYYRRSKVELVLRSAEEADRVWKQIQTDVDELVSNYSLTESLQVVSCKTATTDLNAQITNTPKMSDANLITLEYQPCGAAEIDNTNNQTMLAPFLPNVKGWLPISELDAAQLIDAIPVNAKFYYNIWGHSALLEKFPLGQPYEKHLVHFQGDKLKEGLHYKITNDTIYWLTFVAGTQSNYNISGNAPWGLDYIDRDHPGSEPSDLSILVFTKE